MPRRTSQDVLDAALALGWFWEDLGGEDPVLTNRPAAPWTPITLQPCTWCHALLVLHGYGLAQWRRWGTAYCDRDCKDRAALQRQATKRSGQWPVARGS